ncbi:outer membrane protein assembly factor BamA [soil metagenome]
MFFALALSVAFGPSSSAQVADTLITAPTPTPSPAEGRYQILGITVEGADTDESATFVTQVSGLREGMEVGLPEDPAISEAVRRLYRNGAFSDVAIIADRLVGSGVYLLIRVVEEPRLADYRLEGATRADERALRTRLPLQRGRSVRQSDIERAQMAISQYYEEQGFLNATARARRVSLPDGRVEVVIDVERGDRAMVSEVRFEGNEAFTDATLRRRLGNTPEQRWWRFWSRETFNRREFEEDLQSLITFYNDRGYFGARVLSDSVYTFRDGGRTNVGVLISLEEGPQYHVRNIAVEGNTVFTDDQIRNSVGFTRGDVYNRTRLEQNLFYTRGHTDVSSLYSDRGYLRFDVTPRVVEAPGDSLDITLEIREGDVYRFGNVAIRGNTKTKEHVIRRELRTVPGQVYSRAAIERSIRELMQLSYFEQESLAQGPAIQVDDEDRTVDLTYSLAEAGGDQLELSGGWGGHLGVILQARVTFNNFSIQNLFNSEAYRPLPSGDGQQLSLGVQTAGTRRQFYSLSFTEPWFRGRQTPIGFSLSFARQDDRLDFTSGLPLSPEFQSVLSSVSARVFYRQRLSWPDDFFQTGTDVTYRLYDVQGQNPQFTLGLPQGVSQEVTIRQTLSRNSLDNPLFPLAGSSFNLSLEVAPPVGEFIQYHKWRLTTDWYVPLASRLTARFAGDLGYVGSLTGDEVSFQRFVLGGSPLEAQGSNFSTLSRDLVFLRGYPFQSITPYEMVNGQRRAVGGRILNKYSAELRYVLMQTAQLSLAPYAFVDAGNTWASFGAYNPANLYRSAGFGAKIFLPILGMLDLNWGYQIDPFLPRSDADTGLPQWRFQFSIGS